METRTISLIKAISYRILGSITTFLACLFFTGKPFVSLGVSVFDFFAKIIIFYIHERAWEHIKKGNINLKHSEFKVHTKSTTEKCIDNNNPLYKLY